MNVALTPPTSVLNPPTGCPICKTLFNPMLTCDSCGGPLCEECSCFCSYITEAHAMAAARQCLWLTPLTPVQTLLVMDDDGIVYAQRDAGDCFLRRPVHEDTFKESTHLPTEFAGKHQAHHLVAVEDGVARYSTENFNVGIKRFYIEGRIFTASVFESHDPKMYKVGLTAAYSH
jgi:hypothetical protein